MGLGLAVQKRIMRKPVAKIYAMARGLKGKKLKAVWRLASVKAKFLKKLHPNMKSWNRNHAFKQDNDHARAKYFGSTVEADRKARLRGDMTYFNM